MFPEAIIRLRRQNLFHTVFFVMQKHDLTVQHRSLLFHSMSLPYQKYTVREVILLADKNVVSIASLDLVDTDMLRVILGAVKFQLVLCKLGKRFGFGVRISTFVYPSDATLTGSGSIETNIPSH